VINGRHPPPRPIAPAGRAVQRNVERLEAVIGREAAAFTAYGCWWFGIAWVLAFLCALPLLIWAQLGAPRILWLPASLATLGFLLAACRAIALTTRGADAASTYLSARAGHRLKVGDRGLWVWQWRRSIAKAEDTYREQVRLAAKYGPGGAAERCMETVRRSHLLALFALGLIGFLVGLLVGALAGFVADLALPRWAGVPVLIGTLVGTFGLPASVAPRLRRSREREYTELLADLRVAVEHAGTHSLERVT
jgi:hypothetical protein